MFTGIIESLAEVVSVKENMSNQTFIFRTPVDEPVKVDQSIAHNGVCLTVTDITGNFPEVAEYSVTAVAETLQRTNFGKLKPGDKVNVERCLRMGQRLDGHFVQGHVDATGVVDHIRDMKGSWRVGVRFDPAYAALLVSKGSICVNGVSLTVVDCLRDSFTVAIIPYTWEHTNFHLLKEGDIVNLEFDILGKYLLRAESLRGTV